MAEDGRARLEPCRYVKSPDFSPHPYTEVVPSRERNVAPASSRQTVLLTQKELSRLNCRRDAGATILSSRRLRNLCIRLWALAPEGPYHLAMTGTSVAKAIVLASCPRHD